MYKTRIDFLKYLLGMVILTMPFLLFSQIPIPTDTLSIDSLIATAQSQLAQRAYDKSRLNAVAALEASSSIQDWDRWYQSYDKLAYVYFHKSDFDSLRIQSKHYLDKVKHSSIDPIFLAKLHGWIGFASFYTGDNDLYFNSNLESARIYESIGKAELGISAYINVGVCYTMKGDYKNAEQYLLHAEGFAIEQNNERKFFNIWLNLGRLYWAQKSLDKAIYYYEKAKNLKPFNFVLLNNLAACYRDKSDLITAKKYLDISQTLMETRQDSFLYYTALAKLSQKMDTNLSMKYIKQAISIGDGIQESKRELAQCYLLMANLEFENENYPEAKNGYSEALNLLDTSLYNHIINDLNSIAVNQFSVLNGQWIMESIYGLAKTELMAGNTFDNLAYKYFEHCFDIIDYIRLNFNSEESSLILGDYVREIYQSAMSHACENDAENIDSRRNDFIITCLERSRSFLLSANLNDLKAKKIAEIPDSLLNREMSLRNYITSYRTGRKISTDSEYFAWIRELEKLTTYYKENFPTYYELTNSTKNFKLSEIRSSILKSNQALIYHFEMPQIIYQIGITSDDFVIDRIQKTKELIQNCGIYNRLLSQRNNFSDYEKNYRDYVRTAQFLYQEFLSNFLKRSNEDIQELVFLPNGMTHQIVFEALLEKEPIGDQISYDLSSLEYLLERYSISYAYKININKLAEEKQKYKENFVGFAPKFESQFNAELRTCTPEGLFNLKHSESEVFEIQKTMGGISYTGEGANKLAFLKAMNEAHIVHLATHACVDEISSDQHKIYFSNEEYLNSAELYNISSRAEMVVLSACETGLGQYHSGEGVLSLARTFAYTGIPSVVMSLWSLPDRSTSEIMKSFYQELNSGLPKHEALQQAKLNYINQADATNQHPHYWAALVLIGDKEPIISSWSPYYIGVFIFIIILLTYLLYLRFNKN